MTPFRPPRLPAGLRSSLGTLTAAIDSDELDLEQLLAALVRAVEAAVTSWCGVTLTVPGARGRDVAVSVRSDDAHRARTTAWIPLPGPGGNHAAELLILARVPGTLVDLAADLAWALGLAPGTIRLDAHLAAARDPSGVVGLEQLSMINQAVGILIGHGMTPAAAAAELDARAARDCTSVAHEARRLIDLD